MSLDLARGACYNILKRGNAFMLLLLFFVLMIAVFVKLLFLAIRGAWSITKIVLSVVLFPLILVGIALSGLLYIALLAVVLLGIFSFLKRV